MKEWENEPDPKIAGMLEQAWLYGKMADALRSGATKLRYLRDHPEAVKKQQPS